MAHGVYGTQCGQRGESSAEVSSPSLPEPWGESRQKELFLAVSYWARWLISSLPTHHTFLTVDIKNGSEFCLVALGEVYGMSEFIKCPFWRFSFLSDGPLVGCCIHFFRVFLPNSQFLLFLQVVYEVPAPFSLFLSFPSAPVVLGEWGAGLDCAFFAISTAKCVTQNEGKGGQCDIWPRLAAFLGLRVLRLRGPIFILYIQMIF